MSSLDRQRTGLMGLGKPLEDRTERQKSLALILLCRPLERVFDPQHPHYHELIAQQERFFRLRSEFLTTRSFERLLGIAEELVELNEHLSEHCVGCTH